MKKEEKKIKELLNIFFYYDKKPNDFDTIKNTLLNFKDKFFIKGEFDNSELLLNDIYYYLGMKDEKRGKIEDRQTQNVVISYISLDNAKKLLKSFVIKVSKGIVKNDDHPFFIFLPYDNNANFSIKELFDEVYNVQNNFKDSRKLDSRNIFLENKDTILERIELIYNYYNENNENNEIENDFNNNNNAYDINNTVNIFVVGKRGAGKSTLINRLLGEKRAYAQKNAKTEKTKEYFHKTYPLKLIDSAGFEIGKDSELINVEKFLKTNNLNCENFSKRIHFIFYLFKKDDKFEDKEIEIIKKLYSFNINMFFLITFMIDDEEESSLSEFEDVLKKSFSKDEKEKDTIIKNILDNTFCLDLLNVQYSVVIYNLFEKINEKLKKYKEKNDNIIEYLYNYNYLVKTPDNTYLFVDEKKNILKEEKGEAGETGETEEDKKKIINTINPDEGIIINYEAKDPTAVLELIKMETNDNIFFGEFEKDREKRKNLAYSIVKSYKTPGFWFSTMPIPFLNEYLTRKSKEKMIVEISNIYKFVIKKKLDELDFKENNSKFWVNFVFKIGGFVAGIWNTQRVDKLGEKIIAELDADYAKMNILNVYYDTANQLNKNFEMLKDFPDNFNNSEYWYNINM